MAPFQAAQLAVLILAAVVLVHVQGLRKGTAEEDISPARSEIVTPGQWLTDAASNFLLLPLGVPEDIRMEQCKVMSNGDSLLVLVTEKPKAEAETAALRKYKLVVEALKREAGHDEAMLKSKLEDWLGTEDDDDVRGHISAALESLKQVRQAKTDTTPRTISLPLGALMQEVSSPVHGSKAHILAGLRSSAHGSSDEAAHHRLSLGIIAESFSVEVPYPVPAERAFVLKAGPQLLLAGMPLLRQSLDAGGVSTGGKPFVPLPLFNLQGHQLSGPSTGGSAERGAGWPWLLDAVAHGGLKPLTANT